MTKDQEESGFRVTDKRIFTEGGELRKDQLSDEPPTDTKAQSSPQSPTVPPADQMNFAEEPQIDFPSYILSYYTQGLVLLGEVPNPLTNKKEQDLRAARHTVDILSMLEQKTKGNLSQEEEQLLGSVLYELRMKFMSKTDRIKL